MDATPKRAPGRPATFDRQEAIEQAMNVFWARGYEGTTLEDLLAAMGGISPPSFYHAFRSKEDLFREVADLYLSSIGGRGVRALEAGHTARDAIDGMLRVTAESLSLPGKPHGCLMLGAMNCAAANKGPQEHLRSLRQRAPEVIRRRLERGVADGELARDVDLAAMAAFYATVVQGIGVRAGDGASRAALMAAVDGAMAAWNTLVARRPRKRDKGLKRSRRPARKSAPRR